MVKRWVLFVFVLILSSVFGVGASKVIIPMQVENQIGDKRIKPSWFLTNVFAMKRGYQGKVKRIMLRYTEEKQSRMELHDGSDGVLIENFGLKFENGTLTVSVYYNPEKRDNVLNEEGWVNRDIWAMTCVAVEGVSRDECYKKAEEFGNWSKKWLRLTLISQAYAAGYCSGSIECKANTTTCTCSSGPYSCNTTDAVCGVFGDRGTCTCNTTCSITYVPLACNTRTTEATCLATSQANCAMGGDCPPGIQSCSWCTTSDQGCGAFGCPTNTKRLCDTCTGCQCVPDASCCTPTAGGWSAWSACDASCNQTRTCTNPSPSCGGAGCVGDATQACTGGACTATLTGTMFDATDLVACPGVIDPSLGIGGASFNITSTTPTNNLVTTNANGVYSLTVFPDVLPKTYSFDYTAMFDAGLASAVKFECTSPVATVTTGEIITKNTGFWRGYDAWWQAVGGSVYAGNGLRSNIPSTVLPSGNQRLILADANGRDGVLSHGIAWTDEELGTNAGAAVSDSLRRVQSLYEGLRYDYNFYNTRMDIFASTAWDGGAINYDDLSVGYQIFKHTGNVTLNYGGPTGTQKVILLIDGNVNLTTDLVVPSGAFLGVMASGDITINSNVANVQGWWVAENIIVPCHDGNTDGICDRDDVQLDAQGSFVGWSGVSLTRHLGVDNGVAPAEKFTYRADMVLNAPTPMKVYTRKYSPFIP